MVNDYDKEELKGRGYIQTLFPNNEWHYSSIAEKKVWDLSGSTLSGNFIGEIKIRYNKSDKYDTAFLEKKKYDNLKSIATKNGLTMFYFNIHSDSTMVYNLTKLPISRYTVSQEWCPSTSSENNGWELKEMIKLPINDVSRKIDIGYNQLNSTKE